MNPCCIPDYQEAVNAEKRNRNVIYLGVPEIVAGESLRNITPHLLAMLTHLENPFLCGGNVGVAHAAQFLWACHTSFDEKDDSGPRRMLEAVVRCGLSNAISQIDDFIRVTFMDAPRGGAPSTPIASSIAWLVYRFRCEPFRQPKDVTMQTPLRELYQELRCWSKEQGNPVTNPSDKITGDWLEWLGQELKAGRITKDQIARINNPVAPTPEALNGKK